MPRMVDHDARRVEIAVAACEVIGAEGIVGATMRRIATQANCATGRLTHYYPDKKSILEAATQHTFNIISQRAIANHRPSDTPSEMLQHFLREFLPLDKQRRQEARVIVAFQAQAAAESEDRAWITSYYDQFRRDIESILTHMTTERSALEIIAYVDGLALAGLLRPNDYPPQTLIDLLERFIDAPAPPQ